MAEEATMRLGVDATRARDELGRFTKSVDGSTRATDRLKGQVKSLLVGFSAVASVRQATRIITDFQDAMSTLEAVTGLEQASAQMEQLEATARQLGASTKFSAAEAGQGLVFLARAGFEADEAIAAIPATLDLAAAGSIDLATSADIASNVLGQFNLVAEETGRVGDILVNTTNRSNTNVTQLAEALKLAGPFANAAGVSLEKTTAAIGALGDAGIQGSLAGTNMRGVLAALLSPTTAATNAIEGLGLSFDQVNPAGNDFIDIFQRLADAQINPSQALEIFGRRNAVAAILIAANIEKIKELSKSNEDAAGTASRAATVMSNNLGGSLKSLGSTLQETLLLAGDKGLAGGMRAIVDTGKSTIKILFGFADATDEANSAAQALAITIKSLALVFVARRVFQLSSYLFSAAGAVQSLTKAWQAATLAFSVNPIGATLAGAVTLVTAATAAFAFFGDEADDAKTKIDAVGQSIKGVRGTVESFSRLESLSDKLNISKAQGDATKELEVYDSLLKQVSDRIESISEQFAIGSLTDRPEGVSVNRGEINALIDQARELRGLRSQRSFAVDGRTFIEGGDALFQLQQQAVALKKFRDSKADAIRVTKSQAEAEVEAAAAAKEATGAINAQITALKDQAIALGKSEEQIFRINALAEAQENLSKLQGAAKGKALRALSDEVEAYLKRKRSIEEANRAKEEELKLAERQTSGRGAIETQIESLKRQRELASLNNTEKQVQVQLDQAIRTAKQADIELSDEQRVLIRNEVEERIRLTNELREQEAASRKLASERSRQLEESRRQREAGSKAIEETFRSLREELSLIGKSSDERQRELGLAALKANAQKAEIADVEKLITEYNQLQDAISSANLEKQKAAQLAEAKKVSQDLNAELEFELSLINLTADAQSRAIAIREFSTQVVGLEGKALAEATANYAALYDELQRQSDLKRLFDDVGDSSARFLDGIVSGTASARDALAGLIQDLQQIALRQFVLQPLSNSISGGLGDLFGIGNVVGSANGNVLRGGFQAFANGGLVDRPTLGLIGEGRFNEAVVPLPDGRKIPVDLGDSLGSLRNLDRVFDGSFGQGVSTDNSRHINIGSITFNNRSGGGGSDKDSFGRSSRQQLDDLKSMMAGLN